MSTRATLALSGGFHLYRELDIDEDGQEQVYIEFPPEALRFRTGTQHGILVLKVPIKDWEIIRKPGIHHARP